MITSLALLFVALAIAAYFFGPLILKNLLVKWAAIESKWSPLIQEPATGSFLPIEKWTDDKNTTTASNPSKKVGVLSTILASPIPGFTWNPDTFEYTPIPALPAGTPAPSTPATTSVKTENILDDLGLAWTGFFRRPWRGSITYVSWEVASNGIGGTVNKTRTGPEVFFQHTLALNLKQLNADKTEVEITVVFVVQIWHPKKALFLSGAWIKNLYSAVTQVCKEHVGSKTEQELRTERDTPGNDDLVDKILDLRASIGNGKPGLLESDGVWIASARFEKFDFASDNPELKKARESILVADLNNQAADKEAERIKKLGRAQGERIRSIIEAGPQAIALAGQEAIAEAISKGGSTPIINVGNNPVAPAIVIPSSKP